MPISVTAKAVNPTAERNSQYTFLSPTMRDREDSTMQLARSTGAVKMALQVLSSHGNSSARFRREL
jgi:hypothetical protein